MKKFKDRQQAGRLLASELAPYHHHPDTYVLALPRGGVPVAYEIAKQLALPLSVFLVRKLGVPGHKELAMGAIAGNKTLLNKALIQQLGITPSGVQKVIQAEKKELQRRAIKYGSSTKELKGKTIILVDDGIATGFTMKAAIEALKMQKPAQIIVATPVAAEDTYKELSKMVNKIICLAAPFYFYAVGYWYDNFDQTSDEEVCELLKEFL